MQERFEQQPAVFRLVSNIWWGQWVESLFGCFYKLGVSFLCPWAVLGPLIFGNLQMVKSKEWDTIPDQVKENGS